MLCTASAANAVVLTRALGWGVQDGASRYEQCTVSCETGIAGGGVGELYYPGGVTVDAAGDMYVADIGNARISEYSATGGFLRAWGWGVSDGAGQAETCILSCQAGTTGAHAGQFNDPVDVAVDAAGDVFVSEQNNQRISEFSAAGAFVRAWGWGVSDGAAQLETCTSSCQAGSVGGGAGELDAPAGIAVGGNGDIYVADIDNERIDEFSATGAFVRALGWGVSDGASQLETCTSSCQAGIAGGGAGQLNGAAGIALDSDGDIYVADSGNDRIDEFSPAGGFVSAWGWGVTDGASQLETCTSSCQAGIAGGGAGQLDNPRRLGVDQAGAIYVLDQNNQRIDEFSPAGGFVSASGWGVSDGAAQFETCTSSCQAGIAGDGAGQLDYPLGLAVSGGQVYVGDQTNNRVVEFYPGTAPGISSPASTSFAAGESNQFTVSASGVPAPALSEVGALPAGVGFRDNGDGTASLSGVPAAGSAGTYPISITASNGASPDAVQSFTLRVVGPPTATIATPLAGATEPQGLLVTTSFACQEAPGGPGLESCVDSNGVAALGGASGSASTGRLDTTSQGPHVYSVKAISQDGETSTTSVPYTVGPPLPAGTAPGIASPGSTSFSAGEPNQFTVSASGTPAPALSEVGALPVGIGFRDNGDGTATLSGTPATGSEGAYPISIKASNGVSPDAVQSFSLRIVGPPTATIATPLAGETEPLGLPVTTSFACQEAPGGPGLKSCVDSHGVSAAPGGGSVSATGRLDTSSEGPHVYSVEAISQDGETSTTSVSYTIGPPLPVSAPMLLTGLTPPKVSGIAKAGHELACSTGAWNGNPTSVGYQWSRDGTPVSGATASLYRVQAIDEGNVLTCAVVAHNSAGAGSAATSAATRISVPFVAGCPGASGRFQGATLGAIRIGMTRGRARRALRRSSDRAQSYQDSFCLTPIGIRVGYPSPALLSALTARSRTQHHGKVVWITTGSAYYAIRGIRVGTSLAGARRALKLGRPVDVGVNAWYLETVGAVTAMLEVRRGVVEEIGIADRAFTGGYSAQRRLLGSLT